MKLWIGICCAALLVLTLGVGNADAKVNREPGDIPAFIVGCC
jgi:hypothetical protein